MKERTYPTPPRLKTPDGNERRCGVELEFIGFETIEAIVDLLREQVDGVPGESSRWHAELDSAWGSFGVELDYEYLRKQGVDGPDGDDDSWEQRAREWFNDMLDVVARQLVPWEIVAPPLPLAELARLDPLVAALREAGARGTRHSPAYAFGLHFNPELPALDAATIVRYLRAFVCLQEWLRDAEEIDLTRRLTSYIDDFDEDWARRICADDYRPAIPQLIDDYLEANPTRNRALDMLPLFAHLDEDRVRARLEETLISARPTFHYRLPNCDIDDPDWSLALPWGRWCKVEALAESDRLAETCAAWLADRERWLERSRELVARL